MKKPELKDIQFNHFWEIKCPECGKIIDLEVLVNLMKGGKK
jgi:hypothetical protein